MAGDVLTNGGDQGNNLAIKPVIQIKSKGEGSKQKTETIIKLAREGIPSHRLPWLKNPTISFFSFLKVTASAGQRFYNLRDLLTNPNYLTNRLLLSCFSWVTPVWLVVSLCALATVADALMNAVTRGPSIKKMFNKMFERTNKVSHASSVPVLKTQNRRTFMQKLAYVAMTLCACGSILFASLATFLGIATWILLGTANTWAVFIPSFLSAAANFVSGLSYKKKKALDNLDKISGHSEHKLRWPKWHEWLVLFFGVLSYAALCVYGTAHSINTMLRLVFPENFKDLHRSEINPKYEHIIYGIAYPSLAFSLPMYVMSQCCEMLAKHEEHEATEEAHETSYSSVQRNFLTYAWKNKKSAIAKVMPWMIFRYFNLVLAIGAEMVSNSAALFNATVGFVLPAFRLFSQHVMEVSPEIMTGSTLISAITVAVASGVIYWAFNVKDWLKNLKLLCLTSMVNSLKVDESQHLAVCKEAFFGSSYDSRSKPGTGYSEGDGLLSDGDTIVSMPS